MNNKQEEEKLIEKFSSLSFDGKKKELLFILKELSGISDLINTLGNTVYNINSEENEATFLDIYVLLLGAMYYAKNKQEEKAVDHIERVSDMLDVITKEEKEESKKEEKGLEILIDKLGKIEP